MKNNKSIYWGYGLVLSLALASTGCYTDKSRSEHIENSSQTVMTTQQTAKPTKKSYASKDVVQKATPGPKRAAAPQIPVIQ